MGPSSFQLSIISQGWDSEDLGVVVEETIIPQDWNCLFTNLSSGKAKTGPVLALP